MKVGDIIEIKRVITVMEINNIDKQIKIKWNDKLGKEKIQWVTYKMFLLLWVIDFITSSVFSVVWHI